VSVLQSLKWIFWGVLLAIVVSVAGAGLFNGVLGYAMIAIGMIGLVKNSTAGRHASLIKLIAIVSLFDAFWSPFAECSVITSPVEEIVSAAFGIFNAFAAIGFCFVMRQMCETASLKRAERSWRRNNLLWRVGLPASAGASCLSLWAVRGEIGVISPVYTPRDVMIPLFVLFVIALIVWIHLLVSLWQTIAGLKGMVKKLPSAQDFGLDQEPPVRFGIRALLILAAAAAVILVGIFQQTVPFWHLTMAGLVGLSLLAIWLDRRALGKGLLIVVAVVLLAGYTQLTKHSLSDRICGTNLEPDYNRRDFRLSDSFLTDIDRWLVTQGYEACGQPPDSVCRLASARRCHDLPLPSEAKAAFWYRGVTPNSQGVRVRVLSSKAGERLHFVAIDYDWVVVDFPWTIPQHERNLKRFIRETAGMWQEHLKMQRQDRAKQRRSTNPPPGSKKCSARSPGGTIS
jgi:hypothetical protein